MATRIKQVWLTPTEYATWLPETAKAMGDHVVLEPRLKGPFVEWDGTAESLGSALSIFLIPGSEDLASVSPGEFVPGQLGWVQFDIPRIQGSCLTNTQFGAKGDWYDKSLGQVLESPVSLRRFDRFWRRWKPHFQFSMLGRNVKLGGERVYPGLGYSAGAAEWVRNGGVLRQDVGDNSEFIPWPQPSSQ